MAVTRQVNPTGFSSSNEERPGSRVTACLRHRRRLAHSAGCRPESVPGRVVSEESAMRSLYYRDNYGRVRGVNRAGQRLSSGSGMPARFFVTVLMVLAGIVVIASLTH